MKIAKIMIAVCLIVGGAALWLILQNESAPEPIAKSALEAKKESALSQACKKRGGKVGEEEAISAAIEAADEAFHSGDYRRTINVSGDIVDLDPTDIDRWGVIAYLQWSISKDTKNPLSRIAYKLAAERTLRDCVASNPTCSEAWGEAAQHFFMAGSYALAQRYAIEAVRLEDGIKQNKLLAFCYRKQGKTEQAAAVWEKLKMAYPEDGVINMNYNMTRL